MSWFDRTEVDEVIRATLESNGAAYEHVGGFAYAVWVEGHRLVRSIRLVVGDRSLLAEALVLAKPDDDAAAVYRFLLERNGLTETVHFAIDARGDVYLIGRVPLLAVTPDEIDETLTAIVRAADATYEAARAECVAAVVAADERQVSSDVASLPAFARPPGLLDAARHDRRDAPPAGARPTSAGRHRRVSGLW